ncbi:MAG TPA: hypothetical protein VHV74_08710 [Pseudonocardiaceae bacterium]|nr:hypothetical protein [Pseudonocardiaceae bacterium]
MTVALGANRRRLIVQAAVGVACVAVVIVGLWLVAGFAGSPTSAAADARQVEATVTSTASCEGGDTQDSVSYRLDGAGHAAKLDGCGHQKGERLAVLVSDGSGVVEPADTAPGDSSGLSHRVAFVLLIVATVVGGAFAHRFAHTHRGAPRSSAKKFTPEPPAAEQPDVDYHSDIAPVPRELDPEATGVDWFEDSSARMEPVPPPAEVSERAEKS